MSEKFETDINVVDTISRQAAIEVVEEYADRLQMVDWKENPCVPYKVHALNWCINSLRELPSVQPVNYGSTKSDSSSQLKLNNDLISRKQVLNASHFVACWDGVEHFSLEVVDADFIQKLPSVQPTQPNADSTQCNTLDCVSRQAVIDALTELQERTVASDGFRLGINAAVKELKKMPFAQLEPKEIGYWECSNALLKMWIDNVLTDGEYYRIADKLNTYWKDKIRGKNGE